MNRWGWASAETLLPITHAISPIRGVGEQREEYFTQIICGLRTSYFWHLSSDFRLLSSNFWVPTSDFWLLSSDFWVPASNFWVLTSEFWHPTWKLKWLISNVRLTSRKLGQILILILYSYVSVSGCLAALYLLVMYILHHWETTNKCFCLAKPNWQCNGVESKTLNIDRNELKLTNFVVPSHMDACTIYEVWMHVA